MQTKLDPGLMTFILKSILYDHKWQRSGIKTNSGGSTPSLRNHSGCNNHGRGESKTRRVMAARSRHINWGK